MKFLITGVALLFIQCLCTGQGIVYGKVTDAETKESLPFATVFIKGTLIGTSADEDGNYQLKEIPIGTHTVYCTYIGYAQDSVLVGVSEKMVMHNFSLQATKWINHFYEPWHPVIIESTRANSNTPVSFQNITREKIEDLNSGQDMPYILRMTPSLVTTSDAGNGIGYTGLWIRGTDPTRINITMNGIPLNDAESQQMYWVDLPDIASSTDNIQIQRGVGTSTNGAGAFGGTIKLETTEIQTEPSAQIVNGMGSFNTWRNSVSLNTGLINEKWNFETRLSHISSDGYIDRASSKLRSYFVSGGFLSDDLVVKATAFGGHERTYQAWNGTPASRLENDVEGMQSHAVNNFYTPMQTENLLNAGRTYNYYIYKNEVDDYTQSHYQLHLSKYWSRWVLSLAGHYTRGFGYYEQYRNKESLSSYNLPTIPISQTQLYSDGLDEFGNPFNSQFNSQFDENVSTSYLNVLDENGNAITDSLGNVLLDATAEISASDVIRRRWLENDFYGSVASLRFTTDRTELTLGGAYHEYKGDHFGEIIWMEYANDVMPGTHYYDGVSMKHDANAFAKILYKVDRVILFADMQMRSVNYSTSGVESALLRVYNVSDDLLFFNPKIGITYRRADNERAYLLAAIANREPARTDYVDRSDDTKPLHETLLDVEAGYERSWKKFGLIANAYYMIYKNQLVLTGELNDVGAPLRTNVANSFRRGIELQGQHLLSDELEVSANITLSENKIKSFEETLYDYTVDFSEIRTTHSKTDISFSPSTIASLNAKWRILNKIDFKNRKARIELSWFSKYVGKQFLDNTSDESKIIDPYFVNDVKLSFIWNAQLIKEFSIDLVVNNVLNALYSSNGYTYSYIYGEKITERFYYPQATINFMVNVRMKF